VTVAIRLARIVIPLASFCKSDRIFYLFIFSMFSCLSVLILQTPISFTHWMHFHVFKNNIPVFSTLKKPSKKMLMFYSIFSQKIK